MHGHNRPTAGVRESEGYQIRALGMRLASPEIRMITWMSIPVLHVGGSRIRTQAKTAIGSV